MLSCVELSCVVLCCVVLCFVVLSCLVLSCLVVSCLVLSCLVLSCRVVSCRVLSYRVVCFVLFCFVFLFCFLFCFILFYCISPLKNYSYNTPVCVVTIVAKSWRILGVIAQNHSNEGSFQNFFLKKIPGKRGAAAPPIPFRKQVIPFLTVDAIIGNQAFSHDRCDICSEF